MFIEDGTGSGRAAKVDENNNLGVIALAESPMEAFSHKGDAYSIASDFINLTTTATFTGVLYIKNTSLTQNFHIAEVRVSNVLGALWKAIANPTAGTLISGGVAVVPVSLHHARNKIFPGVVLKTSAGAGLTITDGAHQSQWMNAAYNTGARAYEGAIILAPNNSIALLCKPSAACDVGATITGWFDNFE